MTDLPTAQRATRRFPASFWGWSGVLLVAATGATLWPALALESAQFVVENLISIAPIIAFAVILAAAIHASGADGQMARVFAGRPGQMILAASAFGAITPICGLGVLPIIAGLLAAGVPLAPIMAFWLSSPITDPSMLTITAGTLGLDFAIGKTLVAFAIGLVSGALTHLVVALGGFRQVVKTGAVTDPDACGGCAARAFLWAFWRDTDRRRQFLADLLANGLMITKWLILAFALESLVRRYFPAELVAGYVGADSVWAIPLAVLVGTPLYLDGYAALPFVRGLIELGMAPGAAMAFLVSGGITSLYVSVAVFALVRARIFAWYLLLAMVTAILGGYGYEAYGLFAG